MSSTTSTATPLAEAFDSSVREVKLRKPDLNAAIMDYLISEGFPQAAQKFAQEANIQPPSDIESMQQRLEIREAIHSGNIQNAIENINELNPQLLDEDTSLHFALLRLHLIELIRTATATPSGDITPALTFATTHLAPRAPSSPQFLEDLERTMALLIFTPENLSPQLAALLEPQLRQEVAQRVNRALLAAQGIRAKAGLHNLIKHRSWAHQKALETRKGEVPEKIELGFDPRSGDRGIQDGAAGGPVEPMATG